MSNDLTQALDGFEFECEDYGDSLCDFMWMEEEDVDLPTGRVKFVETYRSWPSADPMVNLVVEFGGKFYENSTYYDSWNGETDWDDSDWVEVEKVSVTTEEWRRVK